VAADVHVPLLGSLHLSTVLVFDLGVYMLVVGAVMLILISLAHQSLRSYRRETSVAGPEAEARPEVAG
jgi:multicomponent K+:H+ antiporter subunit A